VYKLSTVLSASFVWFSFKSKDSISDHRWLYEAYALFNYFNLHHFEVLLLVLLISFTFLLLLNTNTTNYFDKITIIKCYIHFVTTTNSSLVIFHDCYYNTLNSTTTTTSTTLLKKKKIKILIEKQKP